MLRAVSALAVVVALAVSLLAATPGIAGDRLFVLGDSLGGMLVPHPVTLERRGGPFTLARATPIVADAALGRQPRQLAAMLATSAPVDRIPSRASACR